MSLLSNFGFYKSDKIAIAVLVVVIIGSAIILNIDTTKDADVFVADSNVQSADSPSGSGVQIKEGGEGYYYVQGSKVQLFPFDPNTADSTQLLRLGLQPWMVRNIYKYRAAGGIYRTPADFARLYGLTVRQYKILEPYIRISADYKPAAEYYADDADFNVPRTSRTDAPRDTLQYPYKLKPGETISLNTADTTQLKKIPGIGSGYASAIVKRRERLGGYYSAAQLLEIDGFPESALAYIKVDASKVHKLKINEMTYSQLRQHPYLNYYQARDIVDYRRNHGKFKSFSQLEMLDSFTSDDIKILRHYIDF